MPLLLRYIRTQKQEVYVKKQFDYIENNINKELLKIKTVIVFS